MITTATVTLFRELMLREMPLRMNDQCAADEVMSLQKEEGNGTLKL